MVQVSKIFESPLRTPGLVRGEAHWHHFMTKIGSSLACSGPLRERPRPYNLRKSDLVVVRREFLLGTQHIPSGSTGIVTVRRSEGRMFDVMFFHDPRAVITICKFDLLPFA